jgi:hypothetical protein
MNLDFNVLKKSIGKRLKFEANYISTDKVNSFKDVFYATLIEVSNDFIIVEQFTVNSDENYENEKIVLRKRKLVKNAFIISTEIPL